MPQKAEKIPSLRTLESRLGGAIASSLERVNASLRNRDEMLLAPPERPLRIGIGFSGGRDSMSLLEAAWRLSRSKKGARLIESVCALHVNHGLSKNAESWVRTCEDFCARRLIPLRVLKVHVDRRGRGIEAAAREARYRALALAAEELGLDAVLTAHHQDDRLETFLLQWMRGAGIDGLSGMPVVRGFGSGACLLVRPWLEIPRSWIEAYAKGRDLAWVDDESNDDTAFLRNLIRHEVLPVLDRARPGFRKAACRSVELVMEAGEVIHSVAAEDVAHCLDAAHPHAMKITALLELPIPRQALCLRAWIASEGVEPPPRATLIEALRQARQTHSDTALTIRLGAYEIRRWGSDIVLRAFAKPVRDTSRNRRFFWHGENEIELAPWGGVLTFRRAAPGEDGFAESFLRAAPLEARARQGGEKIKLFRFRPSRRLKQLYQSKGIPSFERGDLPLLWRDGRLIFAAGLGSEIRLMEHGEEAAGEPLWVIGWKPDRPLFGL